MSVIHRERAVLARASVGVGLGAVLRPTARDSSPAGPEASSAPVIRAHPTVQVP